MTKVICNLAHLGICEEQNCEHRELHESMFDWDACYKVCNRNQDAGCFNPF